MVGAKKRHKLGTSKQCQSQQVSHKVFVGNSWMEHFVLSGLLESDDDTFNLIYNNFVPLRGQVFAGQSVAQSRQIV